MNIQESYIGDSGHIQQQSLQLFTAVMHAALTGGMRIFDLDINVNGVISL
jgi:hypothetical protein